MFNQKRLPETNRKAKLYSLRGEYNFPRDFKLNLQADFLRSKQSTYDPNFGDDFWKYSDSTALANKEIPYLSDYGEMDLHYFYFQKKGRAITGYSKQNEDFNNYKFELTKSINNHTIKLGGNYKKSEYRFFTIAPYTMRALREYMRFNNWETTRDIPPNELDQILFRSRTQGVGYNLLGEKIEKEGTYYDKPIKPKQTSFYLSDNVTKGDWTVELGLRCDSLNSDMLYYKDSTAFAHDGYWTYLEEYKEGLIKRALKSAWSPRINIIHNTSKNINSYLKLGKYTQFPQYQDVFIDKGYRALFSPGGGNSNNDPRAWDADFITSYQSSYGLEYLLCNKVNANVELYNISTKNSLQTGEKGQIHTAYSNFLEY